MGWHGEEQDSNDYKEDICWTGKIRYSKNKLKCKLGS